MKDNCVHLPLVELRVALRKILDTLGKPKLLVKQWQTKPFLDTCIRVRIVHRKRYVCVFFTIDVNRPFYVCVPVGVHFILEETHQPLYLLRVCDIRLLLEETNHMSDSRKVYIYV